MRALMQLVMSLLLLLVLSLLPCRTNGTTVANTMTPANPPQHHNIRIGTFITEDTEKWILDAIRTNVRVYNAHKRDALSSREKGEGGTEQQHGAVCTIRNTFFIGHTKEQMDHKTLEPASYNDSIVHEADVLQLPFKENMNSGKSLKWFEAAVARYHKADFIIKSDTDTAINFDKLCEALMDAKSDHDVYFGESCQVDESIVLLIFTVFVSQGG